MPWSEKEIHELGDAYFKGNASRCPICQGPVDVEEMGAVGKATTDLLLICRRCGEAGTFSEPHLEAMNLQWTREQKVAIIERYWAHGAVRCPNDGTWLTIREIRSIGQAAADLLIDCKRCCRRFQSSDIEDITTMSPFDQKYVTVRDLGAGGMGTVRLVLERASGQEYAAKTIRPEFLREPEIIRRFQRETRILDKLTHENIVRIRDVYLDETGGVIVMDYLPGGDLSARINDPSMTAELLVTLFEGVCAGMAEVHRAGIVHRDLKPWNVLVDANGYAKITDFGLAVMQDRDSTRLTRDGQFVGTRYYAPPEQLAGHDVEPEADIYSLGLIAYEIYTRSSPYNLPIVLPSNDHDLAQVLGHALATNPADRAVTSLEIASALRSSLMK